MDGNLLSVHQFIKQLKDEEGGQLTRYCYFTELACKQLKDDISEIILPSNENPVQKFIHGDVFEYSVQQAAGHVSPKDDPWIKFRKLYPQIKPREKKQYSIYMSEAGYTAWGLFEKNVRKIYGRKYRSIAYSFGHHIWNNTFPLLTKKLEADMFVTSVPNIVCDIKYSTMTKVKYEEEYLVHAVIQVLIYSLVLNLDLTTLHLRVLVFYSKTDEAVLYDSTIHNQKNIVHSLLHKLKGSRALEEDISQYPKHFIEKFDIERLKESIKPNGLTRKCQNRRTSPGEISTEPLHALDVSTEDEDVLEALNVTDIREKRRPDREEIVTTNRLEIMKDNLWILVFLGAILIWVLLCAVGFNVSSQSQLHI